MGKKVEIITMPSFEILINNEPILLYPKQYEIMAYLANARGKLCSMNDMIRDIFKRDPHNPDREEKLRIRNNMRVHFHRLKKILKKYEIDFILGSTPNNRHKYLVQGTYESDIERFFENDKNELRKFILNKKMYMAGFKWAADTRKEMEQYITTSELSLYKQTTKTPDQNNQSEQPKIKITTIPKFQIQVNGEYFRFTTERSFEILSYLVNANGKLVSEAELIRSIIKREPSKATRNCIRVCWCKMLKDLRNVKADHIVNTIRLRGKTYRYFVKGETECDILEILSHNKKEIRTYIGKYMEGMPWNDEGKTMIKKFLDDNGYKEISAA